MIKRKFTCSNASRRYIKKEDETHVANAARTAAHLVHERRDAYGKTRCKDYPRHQSKHNGLCKIPK